MCTGKNKKQKSVSIYIHKKQTKLHYTNYCNSQHFVLDKLNVARVLNYVSFSCRKCFLSFHLKVKLAKD